MNQQSSDKFELIETRNRDDCHQLSLVLVAAGLSTQILHRDGQWFLCVKQEEAAIAAEEIAAYRIENQGYPIHESPPVAIYQGAYVGIVVYCAVITLIAVLGFRGAFGIDWLSRGRVEVTFVLDGQWWRAITALTLHLDVEHLISNLVFGSLFGLLAGRVFGGGTAWLGMVVAGSIGNYLNSMIQPSDHRSLGASTSVFAALGMITSHSFVSWTTASRRSLAAWAPMIGGVLLLAMLGMGGERTDVAAHFAGFSSGLAVGWAMAKFPMRWLASRAFQISCGLSAVWIVTFAWFLAIKSGP